MQVARVSQARPLLDDAAPHAGPYQLLAMMRIIYFIKPQVREPDELFSVRLRPRLVAIQGSPSQKVFARSLCDKKQIAKPHHALSFIHTLYMAILFGPTAFYSGWLRCQFAILECGPFIYSSRAVVSRPHMLYANPICA